MGLLPSFQFIGHHIWSDLENINDLVLFVQKTVRSLCLNRDLLDQ